MSKNPKMGTDRVRFRLSGPVHIVIVAVKLHYLARREEMGISKFVDDEVILIYDDV